MGVVLRDAALYDRVIGSFDHLGLIGLRRRLVTPLAGAILEIGVGTGLTFPHYGPDARVVGIEPEPTLLAGAASRAKACGVVLCRAQAENLPFADATFDTIVTTLVFCSIPDAALAGTLTEVRRVLRPGGRFVQLEHTRSGYRALDMVLDAFAPLWLRASGGCHVNRDTAALLVSHGWQIARHERYLGGIYRLLVSIPPDDPKRQEKRAALPIIDRDHAIALLGD